MTPDSQTPLEARIKASLDASLDASAQSMDADTQQRLNAMRRAAFNQPAKTHWLRLQYWLPATSLAFCTVVGMMLWLPTQAPAPSATLEHTAMLELIENPEEIEVMSDPGFYLWLDEVSAGESESMVSNAV